MLRQLIISAHALFLNLAKKIDAGGDEKLIINFMWPKCGWYVSITARSKHKLALGLQLAARPHAVSLHVASTS